MKKILIGWLLLLSSIIVLNGTDYLARRKDGHIKTGELDETVYWLIQCPIILIVVYLWWTGSKRLDWPSKLLLMLFQSGLAMFIWFYITLSYICYAGIDCT
ncbi:hypothetical protein [Gynuella sunshinyii]|uniref:Uncharacterized protein n=1 Tax=Gynuella sunshinyii YC6258 TaxID=1445510 RepID=A0A0C5W1L6_9GAMM|nr:hypothetical protein [Gynuella sunshinyii]AJQ96569.1 hypothetical Protein YC6258_04537 [Gynuella sunshinyii YC6258]